MSQLPYVPNMTGSPSQFGQRKVSASTPVLRVGTRQKQETASEFLQRFNPEAPDLVDVFKGGVVDTGRLLTAGLGNIIPGEDIFEDWAADLGALRARHPEWNTRHVDSAWQLISNPGLLLENVVAQAPYMIGALASYGVGSLLGGAAGIGGLAGKAATFGFAALVEGQSAYEDAISYGASESEAQFAGMLTGSINGMLELAQLGGLVNFGKRMGRSAGRAMTRNALEKLADLSSKGYIKALTGPLAKELAAQSFQEMLQGTSAESIAYQVYGKPVEEGFLDRRMQEAIGVSASTLLFAGGARGFDAFRGGEAGFKEAMGQGQKPKVNLQVIERAAVERFGMSTSDANRFTYGFVSPILQRFGEQYGMDATDVLDKHLEGFVDAFNDTNVLYQDVTSVAKMYSELRKQLDGEGISNHKTMPAKELLGTLLKRGVKEEEMRWTGLYDLLKDNDGAVNIDEVRQLVAKNEIKLDQFIGQEMLPEELSQREDLQNAMYKLGLKNHDVWREMEHEAHRSTDMLQKYQTMQERARARVEERMTPNSSRRNVEYLDDLLRQSREEGLEQSNPKFVQLLQQHRDNEVQRLTMESSVEARRFQALQATTQRLRGQHEQYTQIVMSVPSYLLEGKKVSAPTRAADEHFQPGVITGLSRDKGLNTLVFLRGDVRQTKTGKSFFVYEIQSDWGREIENNKAGFKKSLKENRVSLKDPRAKAIYDRFKGYYDSQLHKDALEVVAKLREEARVNNDPVLHKDASVLEDQLVFEFEQGLPDAGPLLDRYQELAIKTALVYAYNQGLDRVDFVTGDTRAHLSGHLPGNEKFVNQVHTYDVRIPEKVRAVLRQLGVKDATIQESEIGPDAVDRPEDVLSRLTKQLQDVQAKQTQVHSPIKTKKLIDNALHGRSVTLGIGADKAREENSWSYMRLLSSAEVAIEFENEQKLDETRREIMKKARAENVPGFVEVMQGVLSEVIRKTRHELMPLVAQEKELKAAIKEQSSKMQFNRFDKLASHALVFTPALKEALSRGVPLFQEQSERREKAEHELFEQLQKANPEAFQSAMYTEAVVPEKPGEVLYQDSENEDAPKDVVYPILFAPKSPNIEARKILWKQIMKRTMVALGSYTHPSTGNRLIAAISVEDIPEDEKPLILQTIAEMDKLPTTQERYWYGREKLGEATMKKIYRTFGLAKIKESTPDTDLYQEPAKKGPSNGLRTPPMFGGYRGGVKFLEDGKALVAALENADFSTLVHEFGHIFRRVMADIAKTQSAPGAIQAGQDLAIMEQWAGVKDGKWEVKHEEKFAKAFEKWVMTGKAPLLELQGHFAKFKSYMERIYLGAKSYFSDVRLSPDIRGVFDRMFAADTVEIAETRKELQELYEASEIPDEAILSKISNKDKEKRAYELWEKGGRKQGMEQEYWNAAELELRSEALKEKGATKNEYKTKLKKLEQLLGGQTLISNDDNHLPHIQQRMIDYLATSSPPMGWFARMASKIADPIRGLWSMIAPIEKVPSGKVFANIMRDMNVFMNMMRGQFEERIVRAIDALSESDKAWLTDTEGTSGLANIVRMIDVKGTPRALRLEPKNQALRALRDLVAEIQLVTGQASVDARMMQSYGERSVVPLAPNKFLTLPRVATQEMYHIVQSPGGLEHQILVAKIKELNPDLRDPKVIEKMLENLYGAKVNPAASAQVREIRVMPSYIDVPGRGKIPLVRLTPYDLLTKSIESNARRAARTRFFGVAPLFEGVNFESVIKLGKKAGMELMPTKKLLIDVMEDHGVADGEYMESLELKSLVSMAKDAPGVWQQALKEQLIAELEKVDPVKIKGTSVGFTDRTLSYRERFVRPEDTDREEFDGYVTTWAAQRKQFMKLTGFEGEIYMRQTADGPVVDFIWDAENEEQRSNFENQVQHFINKKFYGELRVGDLESPAPRSGATKVPDQAPRVLTKQAKAFEMIARLIRGVDPKQDPVFLKKDMIKRLTEPQPDVLGQLKNKIVAESKDPAIVERIDNVLRVWEGLPYHQMPRNLFTRGAKVISNILGTLQTSLSVIPNTVQTASLVPIYAGIVNYEKAIDAVWKDKNMVASEMAMAGAFAPAVYQWSLDKGFWLEGIGRNVRQAVNEGTGLRLMGELNGLIAAKAHDYLYQQWSQKFTSRDESAAIRLGLSPEDIENLKNKRLSSALRAKIIQLGTQRTQFVTEATFERGEIENRPFMRMLFAYSNYTMGMMRSTIGLIDEWKRAFSSGENFKRDVVPVMFKTFVTLAASAGVGVAGMLLRNAVKGKLPGEDDETLRERALAGLTEIQLLGAAQRMMGGFEYAEGNLEKAWIGLMPHAQAVSDLFASVFRLNKFRDFPIGDRMVQYAKRQFPLLAALTGKDATELEWMDFYAFPQQQAYMEASNKVNKWVERQPKVSDYAKAGVKERKFFGAGVVNPDFDEIFQAVKRGDVEGSREAFKELLYKLRSDRNNDPVQALQNLKRSLVMRAPLTMKDTERAAFLRSLSADDRQQVYHAHVSYMRIVNSLIPSKR